MSLVQALGVDTGGVPRLATGFGGGMAGHGEVCGALVGATIALGMAFGRDRADDTEAKATTVENVRRLLSAFEDRFGSIRCIDLTGCDMLTAEGRALAVEKDLHGRVCPDYVGFVVAETLGLVSPRA